MAGSGQQAASGPSGGAGEPADQSAGRAALLAGQDVSAAFSGDSGSDAGGAGGGSGGGLDLLQFHGEARLADGKARAAFRDGKSVLLDDWNRLWGMD